MKYDIPDWLQGSVRVDQNGCWIWQRRIAWNGYGSCNRSLAVGVPRTTIAHRVVYQRIVGIVSRSLDLDHLCRVRACVNPAHLEPVTRSVNLARSPLKNRHANRTHCKHGHALTDDNVYLRPDRPGRRVCRTCAVERTQQWRDRQAGVA